MGLLDKLEQVEIKADSRLPEDDLMFCETHQQAYDESCRALREIRQQWKKAIQAQRDLLGIGQDGSLPYFGSNYRFGITDLNRELEKFHSRFISELTQHFNEKYSVTISTDAIKEHLIPAEPDPYRCDMDTSKEYHRNLRDLSLHYAQSIESNLMQMILAKEKLNLFMKGDEADMDDIYERFGVDYDLTSLLLYRDIDEDGRFSIRWGEQEIA